MEQVHPEEHLQKHLVSAVFQNVLANPLLLQ